MYAAAFRLKKEAIPFLITSNFTPRYDEIIINSQLTRIGYITLQLTSNIII
jgi:hypothetical protein